jgi:hypothetical protein
MKIFVEPLLMWKGDVGDVPSGSHNPEGSDANPGHGQTRESMNQDLNVTEPNPDGNGSTSVSIPIVLMNNQYAVLWSNDND